MHPDSGRRRIDGAIERELQGGLRGDEQARRRDVIDAWDRGERILERVATVAAIDSGLAPGMARKGGTNVETD